MVSRIIVIFFCATVVLSAVFWAQSMPDKEHKVGGYSTSLHNRRASQVHNVSLAARKIDGTVIPAGGTFSFLKTVGPWTSDQGYVRAPVSFEGEMVNGWGGGVCQASSTLYNAALLSGMEIVERHRHHWPAKYAPLGRDAAVSYGRCDLKFTNKFSVPVTIRSGIRGNNLYFSMHSTQKDPGIIKIASQVDSIIEPDEVIQHAAATQNSSMRIVNPGRKGYEVTTFRITEKDGKTRRELVSSDTYPSMNRVCRIVDN